MINRPIIIIILRSPSLLMLSKHDRRRLLFLHRHWGSSSSSSSLMAAASYYSSSSSSLVTGNNNNKALSNSNSNSKGLILFHHLPSFSSSAVNPPNNPSPITTTALPLYLASRGSASTSFHSSISTTSYSLRLINWRIKSFKGCRCSNNHNHSINNDDAAAAADDDDISNNTNTLHNRAFAPSLPHLLSHSQKPRLEQDNNNNNRDANDVVLQNGTYRTSSSIGFPNRPPKIVVAVDVDEVLGSFLSALNSFIADRYSSNHSVSEYHVYEFFKIWNCSRDEAAIRVHEFFKTSYFKAGIHPIPGARQALQKLSRFYNLSVVTSRQNAIKDHTIEWIEKHYPSLFQGIHFGNHFALDGQSRPKSDICRSLGADVLIDDNPRYAIECAEAGIRVLLFDYENSYPWCKTESVTRHPLVTKVHNWGEVEHRLVSRTFS